MKKEINEETKKLLLEFQCNEITEHVIYKKLSLIEKGKNKFVLEKISNDELKHYNIWKKYTGKDVKPDRLKIMKYSFLAKLAGLTFAIKLMEKGEEHAQDAYKKIIKIPEAKSVLADENRHEKEVIAMISEEKLDYIGSIILGLSDALVELTGTIAGLTLALQNTKVIGLAASITGIAASLSMASSEYLSKKSEDYKNPFKAAIYTGITYIFAVILLVLPYFIMKQYYFALAWTLFNAILMIFIFTYFMSVSKDLSFKKKFTEMAAISLSVALISFAIGYLFKLFSGISI